MLNVKDFLEKNQSDVTEFTIKRSNNWPLRFKGWLIDSIDSGLTWSEIKSRVYVTSGGNLVVWVRKSEYNEIDLEILACLKSIEEIKAFCAKYPIAYPIVDSALEYLELRIVEEIE